MSTMPNDNGQSFTRDPASTFPPPVGSPAQPQMPFRPQLPSQPQSLRVGRPYGNGRRLFYGSLWGFYTAALVIGSFAAMFGGQVLSGLFGLALGALAGRYDYRIWTWQARRLWFLIIF